ncbi:MAG: GWxTD domain-containing protein [Melioribacteraceae bacterium]|nr:GWxTD domain-containing protein [Melioribacteraceae bacterium]MCF8393852.1 GWxTD domain-containing protein [Melioribacteraceae bacterium]MCF8418225.1 GWxTD domain-containing protein [Melioribacteraceae bacterium]
MKKIIVILLMFVSIAILGQNKFEMEFDYARFYLDESMGFLEIYYAFDQATMSPLVKDGQSLVSGELGIKIQNVETGAEVVNKNWKFDIPSNKSNPNQQILTGVLRFPLNNGNYRCAVIGKDLNGSVKKDSSIFNLEMNSLTQDSFSISDIEVASSIKQFSEDTESIFYKNTLEVVPNPNRLFGEGIPVLYFYSEIYHPGENSDKQYRIDHYLFNDRNIEKFKKTKYLTLKNSAIVEIGAIKVNDLPSGGYNLVVAVSDTSEKATITATKRIYVYNPSILDSTTTIEGDVDLLSSELAVMAEDELEEMFTVSKYIASKNEIDSWKQMTTLEGKRNFIYDFWKRRDEKIETPQNETKIEYFNRVAYADEHFSNLLQKRGANSDQGRVYIVYGPPSEIIRHPFESETVPYEIWDYEHIEGGVRFIFADFSGFKEYNLIHSDKRGELQDVNWEERISR